MAKKPPDELSDKEAEERANAALRRALATPYKPQSEMVGKAGKQIYREPAKKKGPVRKK